jgi:vitamin B12 transporter
MDRIGLTAYRNRVKDLIVYEFPTVQNVDRAHARWHHPRRRHRAGRGPTPAERGLADPTDDASGKLLTYRARRHATLDASGSLGAWDLGATLVASTSRYADPGNTQRLPGYARWMSMRNSA